MVAITTSAKGDPKKVKIDPKLVDPNEVEVLEDLIVAALRDARQKAEALTAEEMGKLTGGLQLPPGFKLPF
jgi:DNA-binding protein YbaB